MKRSGIKNTKAYQLGNSGEKKVKLLVDKLNDPKYNLRNIVLVDKNNDSHQIDVVCIHDGGVFVIEVKNVCGYEIQCGNELKYWTYKWVKDKKLIECKIYNPIWQNDTHCQQVRRILDNDYPVYSVVVFSNNNKLVSDEPLNEVVLKLNQVADHLSKFPKRLSEADKQRIKTIIEKNNRTDISLKEHVDSIRRRFY